MSRLIEFKKKLGTFFGKRIEVPMLLLIRFLEKTFLKNIRYYFYPKASHYWGGIVVPIKEAIHPSIEITTSQEIIEIAKRAGVIGVIPCFCRTYVYHDHECKAPVKTCITLGTGQRIKDLAKSEIFTHVSLEEIEAILRQADEYGLVHQLIYFPNPEFFYVICNCCDCCCAVLSTYKRLKNHIKQFGDPLYLIKPSDFIAKVDADLCQGCQTCLARCKFYAIEIKDNKSITIESNCKGCGLCATKCPTGARKLFLREKKEEIF
jgi:NAD-dependent dihydropyrimidine dehydrogenase PreA subunit